MISGSSQLTNVTRSWELKTYSYQHSGQGTVNTFMSMIDSTSMVMYGCVRLGKNIYLIDRSVASNRASCQRCRAQPFSPQADIDESPLPGPFPFYLEIRRFLDADIHLRYWLLHQSPYYRLWKRWTLPHYTGAVTYRDPFGTYLRGLVFITIQSKILSVGRERRAKASIVA